MQTLEQRIEETRSQLSPGTPESVVRQRAEREHNYDLKSVHIREEAKRFDSRFANWID